MYIVDISSYDKNIDWNVLSKEVSLVILRASVGMNKDKKYLEYTSEMKKRKIPYHAYHYVKATNTDEAKSEAKVFSEATESTDPLFYIIDAEYSEISSKNAKQIFETFESELKKVKDNNIRVALYIGHHLYDKWNLDYSRYSYIWIPRYGTNSGQPEKMPKYPCDLWQYTSKGHVNGIEEDVDLNELTGSKPLSFFITKPIITKHTLKKGNRGGNVKELQQYLVNFGYDIGSYGIDGDFGTATENAVKEFQKDHELVIDGIVGKKTWGKIYEVLG